MGVLALLLLLGALFRFPIPSAAADGASSTEEVWVEWRYPVNLGNEVHDGGTFSIEDRIRANKFNVSGTAIDVDYDNLQIYWMQGVFSSDDNDDRPVRFTAYNYTSDVDGGARYGYDEQTIAEGVEGWRGGTFTDPIDLGNVSLFFYGAYTAEEDGTFHVGWTAAGKGIISFTWSDPFDEDATANTNYGFRFRVNGFKNTTTGHNQYYGDADNYTARRDINYTFPVASTNRRIEATFPNTEYLVNITYSNGGLFNAAIPSNSYTITTYNSTHQTVVLLDSAIGTYGGDLRIFTQTYNYGYDFYGLFFENGTSAGAVNVTAYFINGSTTTFEVNGNYTLSTNNIPESFTWPVSTDIRRIVVATDDTEYTLFTPEDTYEIYGFEIRDYTGTIGAGDTWLESYRMVNNTEYMIERQQIQDTVNEVPLLLVVYRVYIIQALLSDGTANRFGYFIPGVDTTPTLSIRNPSFSRQTQLTYRYVAVEATRPTDTSFIVDYEDDLDQTTLVELIIKYRNGTTAYSDSSGANPVQFNWNAADNETDYIVDVNVTHQFFGTLKYSKAFGGATNFNSTPSMGFLGTWGGASATNILPAISMFVISGAFSVASVPLGAFSLVIMAAVFNHFEFMSIDYTLLSTAMGLAILIAIGHVRRTR